MSLLIWKRERLVLNFTYGAVISYRDMYVKLDKNYKFTRKGIYEVDSYNLAVF